MKKTFCKKILNSIAFLLTYTTMQGCDFETNTYCRLSTVQHGQDCVITRDNNDMICRTHINTSDDFQLWKILQEGDGNYKIQNKGSKLFLNGSTNYPRCSNLSSTATTWRIYGVPGGPTFRIQNVSNGSQLDMGDHRSHPTYIHMTGAINNFTSWYISIVDPQVPKIPQLCFPGVEQTYCATIKSLCESSVLKELFETYLIEDKYKEAYGIIPTNQTGVLWNRRLKAMMNKTLEKFIRRSVFEDDLTAKQNALTLVESFKGTPHYEELAALKTTVEAAAEERKNIILSNPQVAVMGDYMKAELLKMLVSDDS